MGGSTFRMYLISTCVARELGYAYTLLMSHGYISICMGCGMAGMIPVCWLFASYIIEESYAVYNDRSEYPSYVEARRCRLGGRYPVLSDNEPRHVLR